MEKLSRRSFFRLAGGGVAAAIVAPQILLEKVINIPVEFGWTWFVDKSKIEPTLGELVSRTLRNNHEAIVNNLYADNALLAKLSDGTKVQLNIEKISEEEQTKRIIERANQRLIDRDNRKIEQFKDYQLKLMENTEKKDSEELQKARKLHVKNTSIWLEHYERIS